MEKANNHKAHKEYLLSLKGAVLEYALKSRDMNLFDIGFVKEDERTAGDDCAICAQSFAIHVSCALSIIENNEKTVYYGDCDKKQFEKHGATMFGSCVHDVSLGEFNMLVVRLDNCSIEIVPADDGEESWRFFRAGTNAPHLVATDEWIDLHNYR